MAVQVDFPRHAGDSGDRGRHRPAGLARDLEDHVGVGARADRADHEPEAGGGTVLDSQVPRRARATASSSEQATRGGVAATGQARPEGRRRHFEIGFELGPRSRLIRVAARRREPSGFVQRRHAPGEVDAFADRCLLVGVFSQEAARRLQTVELERLPRVERHPRAGARRAVAADSTDGEADPHLRSHGVGVEEGDDRRPVGAALDDRPVAAPQADHRDRRADGVTVAARMHDAG